MEPTGYLPVVMQSLVALGFVATVLIIAPRLGPRRHSKKKDENFECGIESQGNARIPVSTPMQSISERWVPAAFLLCSCL
jgi:NADH:ubiquinone oxidoreductase subunit 3 (subunit A)